MQYVTPLLQSDTDDVTEKVLLIFFFFFPLLFLSFYDSASYIHWEKDGKRKRTVNREKIEDKILRIERARILFNDISGTLIDYQFKLKWYIFSFISLFSLLLMNIFFSSLLCSSILFLFNLLLSFLLSSIPFGPFSIIFYPHLIFPLFYFLFRFFPFSFPFPSFSLHFPYFL
jgi:hypothetical protein